MPPKGDSGGLTGDPVAASLGGRATYNVETDFAGVSIAVYVPLVITAHPSVPANNLKELLALAKAKPNTLNFGSVGNGSSGHLTGELLNRLAGINLTHIPYKGSSGARTDVIGGQVDMMFDAVTTMTEQVKAGKVRAIATSGKQRSEVLPDVPTLSEAGVPGYEATIWLGLLAPKGTPKAITDKLNDAVSKISSLPEVRQLWVKQGAVPMVMTPAVFEKYLQDDVNKWAVVIKSANIKPD